MTRFLAVLLCFLSFLPIEARAQQALSVRTGLHEDYARIVFDWPTETGYTLEKPSDSVLLVTFDKDATVSSTPIDGNVKDFKVISSKPLKVSIMIPSGSRTRDFKIGTKIMFDIYNPEGAPKTAVKADPPPEPKKEEPKPEVKKAEVKKQEPKLAAKPPEKAPVKPEEKKEEAKVETPVTEKPVGALLAQSPQVAVQKAAEAAPKIAPHVITFTSTVSIGMAVFEEAGQLWMATDQDKFDIKPQLNGPHPDLFPGFKEQEISDGQLYMTKTPEGSLIAPQGGGLLWRIVVSSKANSKKPTDPVRTPGDDVRGGSLTWPFKEAHKVMDVKDPLTGDTLKIITTENSGDYAGAVRDFVDFETLTSDVGLVIRPKVDDLIVKVTQDGVTVSRPGGLAIMPEDRLALAREENIKEERAQEQQAATEGKTAPLNGQRIFSFAEWQMGGMEALKQNNIILLSELHDKADGQRYEDLITLAKMYIANGRGAEALGYLNYALNDLPGLDSNPDFLALRGVAYDLNGDAESAFRDLSIEDLKVFPEIQYWRAYALANLGDWQQAYEILPPSLDALYDYPETLRYEMALVLAEVHLRAANTAKASNLLDVAGQFEKDMPLPFKSSLQYLRGEMARQAGDKKKAKALWEPLTKGNDDLYRAKAGLALTRLEFEGGDIDTKKAIDNLEHLRYAWRGDELEAGINYWLGRVYFDSGQFVKGLTIMRDAATYAPGTNLGKRISVEMNQAFQDLFLSDKLQKVSALDAVTLYEQFGELMPAGETGEKIVQKLAEHLVAADLLGRAGDLLQKQLDGGKMLPDSTAKTAVRIAAIRLLDRQPEKAFADLDKADAALKTLPKEIATPARLREISLLRARAFSQNKNPNQALTLLAGMEQGPDVHRLRADIAWQAAYWQDAADALKDVIADENISMTKPPGDDQANMILNRAIALNLTGDRVALAEMREQYSDLMAQSKKARPFEVVTRPRQNAALADRQTLMGMVSEVDLFSEFLNAYKADQTPSN